MAAIGIVRREKGSNGAVTVTRDHTHFFTLHSPATLAAACSFFSVVHFLANTPQENKVFSCVFFFWQISFLPTLRLSHFACGKNKKRSLSKKIKREKHKFKFIFLIFFCYE